MFKWNITKLDNLRLKLEKNWWLTQRRHIAIYSNLSQFSLPAQHSLFITPVLKLSFEQVTCDSHNRLQNHRNGIQRRQKEASSRRPNVFEAWLENLVF